MRADTGDYGTNSSGGGIAATETIQLIPARPKVDDFPVRTNTPLQTEPEKPSPRTDDGLMRLDDPLVSPQRQQGSLTSPPRPQGTNTPNLAGAGSGSGGSSTPNAIGGGGGGGGGGGANVTNASQFMSANLASAGTVFSFGFTQTAATPAASAVSAASAAPPAPVTPANPPPSGNATPPAPTAMPKDVPAGPSSLASSEHAQVQGGSDPLYVLDMNTGETIPANTPLNSFSTWAENLQAQVSGATVGSYSWNTSQAPDLTNISGANTANLQGTWANFTGAARTDTITVTETPTVGQQLSQTITFQIAGTNSPGYSASRPTSSNTWANVLTPDQVMASQATVEGGPYASLGLADGSVMTSFAMPSYNPGVAPVGLDYSSTAANAQPIFLVHYQLPTGQSVPATITASLTLNNGTPVQTVYNTSNLNPGDYVQIALQGNAATLSTGRYPWQITVTNGTNTNYSGSVDIVNQAASPFGAGWSLDNVEQLVPVSGGVILVQPGGTSLWFASNGQGGYVSPAGDFSTLTLTNGVYTRTLTDGTQVNFNSGGLQTSIVDRDGNTTTFGYNGSNQLTGITDMNGLVTTLTYNASGQLSSIQDPALGTATLGYTGGQLTSITDPQSDLWQYGYDTSNHLTALTDPRNDATTFAYNFAGRVATVTRADSTTEQLTAVQMNGLASPGTGTSGNPAASVLVATGAQAQYTDPRNNVWTTGLDWLGFGQDVADIDPLGDAALTYRDANDLAWLTADPLGRRNRDFFDSKGNVTKDVQADDSYSQYSYNSFAEVTQATDPTNDTTTYTYNSKGDQTQKTDALNHTTTYTYNSKGFLTSVTDPNNHTTTYGLDSRNRVVTVTNALNQTITYAYDSASNKTGQTDARNFTSTFAFDKLGRMTGETLADTSTTSSTYTFVYDGVGNKTSVTDPLNHTTSYSFDKLNQLVSMTDALNETTTYGYDATGNQTTVTNPLSQTTTFGFDAANRLTALTNALNQTTSFAYDAAGQKTSQTNPLNQTTSYSYTLLGKMASVTDPLSDVTSFGYNAAGDKTSESVGGTGQPTLTRTMTYNAVHQLASATDFLNNTTSYGYDAAGNQITVTDPLNHTTTYSYNAINQRTAVTDALSHTTSYGYDADGNQITVTDALNRTTTSTFDAQGRLLSVTDPRNGTTSYSYDLAGNKTSITDPDSNTTSYTYNAINQLIQMTDPLSHSATYAYNAAGQQTGTTDRDGRSITYSFDAVGHRTGETWAGGGYTATWTYNAAGQLTAAQDTNSSYSYTYNSAGELTSVDNAGTPGVPHVVLSNSFDVYGDRTSLSDSLGGSISYTFNNDLEMSNLALTLGSTTAKVAFGYDAAGRLTGLTPVVAVNLGTGPQGPFIGGSGNDTLQINYSYDNANHVTGITDTDATKGVTLANYTYGYDVADQLTSYQDANSSLTYGYDQDGQLTSASGTLNGSSYNVGYSFDANGNRTMAGYRTGTGNQLKSDGTYNYTYDNEGNTLSQTNIATGYVTLFSWDYRNRLTEVKAEDNHGTILNDEKFTYDVNNNRIGASLNGTQQSWTVFDGKNPYMDFSGSGTLTERYLTNPAGLNQFYGQMNASGTTQWFLTDILHSIRQVVSSSGVMQDGITYDPFGNIVSQTNSANAPRFLYAGGVYDSITGDDQFNARYYSSKAGRFRSEDPLSFGAGDSDLYRYVFNVPTITTDPSGMIEPEGVGPIALNNIGGRGAAAAIPPGATYIDINITGGFWFGITGGIQYDIGSGTWHPYVGAGFVTPGIGGSVSVAPGQSVSTGWQGSVSGTITGGPLTWFVGGTGQVGYSPGGWFGEIGIALGTPGASATAAYVW